MKIKLLFAALLISSVSWGQGTSEDRLAMFSPKDGVEVSADLVDCTINLRVVSTKLSNKSSIAISDTEGNIVVSRYLLVRVGTTFLSFKEDLKEGVYDVVLTHKDGSRLSTKLVINKSK